MFRHLLPLLLLAAPVAAQVTYPKPPAEYEVTLRYRIRATGEQRIDPFDAMTAHLKKIGFKHADEKRFKLDQLDPGAETVVGTLPAEGVANLLDNASIKTAVLQPAGGKLFDDPKKLVPLRIELANKLPSTEQKQLHAQATEQLVKLGFAPGTGYDHKGYTRLRGTLPAGEVPQLVKDLRALPGGWFVGGAERYAQPLPFSAVLPVRTVEVLPDLPVAELVPTPADGSGLTTELKAVVDDANAKDKPLVVEAVLETDTSNDPATIRRDLRAALVGMSVEGLAGPVVTVRLPRAEMAVLVAKAPGVRHVRLARVGTETTKPTDAKPTGNFVVDSRLSTLHALGYDGKGVVVVVIASEFPGVAVKEAKEEEGKKPELPAVDIGGVKLPAGSRLIDLTAELRRSLDPAPADPARGNGGTAAALAVHTAAPGAPILLVRVDPSRLHQVLSVAKAVVGESAVTPAMLTRTDEMKARTAQIEADRRRVTAEVEKAFSDLSDDPAQVARREAATAALKKLKADTADYNAAQQRYLGVLAALEPVKGAGVVVNTLVWETGHPNDGQSELARLIETKYAVGAKGSALAASRQPPTPAWVQAGGVSVGTAWSGPFRDTDGNRVMEFTAPKSPLTAGRWTNEFAFVGFRAGEGKAVGPLPQGLKVRVTIQWREPHRADLVLPAEPMNELKLKLFRQLDPDGKTAATDELTEVAASAGVPVRLMKTPTSGVYEATLSATLPAAGVYALRVDGGPVSTNLPPSAKLDAEISPRITLELPDPADAAKGRLVFDTDAVQKSGVGIPGDSLGAVTVGVGTEKGATTATGVGPGVGLGTKPDLLADGVIAWEGGGASGPGVAAGYLGGASACLMQAGVRPSDLVKTIGLTAGQRFELPAKWLASLSPNR